MSNKSANVSVRVQPEIKKQAEEILEKLGIPVSVLIDTLYRQIILTGGIPYSLVLPKITSFDNMSKQEFDLLMKKGIDEALNNQSIECHEAFAKIKEGLK